MFFQQTMSAPAVKSIYQYNFKPDLSEHVNCQRTFALGDEAGLILCTWPHGGQPKFPFPYSDEVWTGIEYHVAAHLITMQDGLMKAWRLVRAARARHDGFRRSPWDEVECGHHYARSMSAWTLLLALTGFSSNADRGEIRFDPIILFLPNPMNSEPSGQMGFPGESMNNTSIQKTVSGFHPSRFLVANSSVDLNESQ